MNRRLFLAVLPALAGCSVLPDRPYQEARRFALAPEPPRSLPPAPGGPVLLLRPMRAAPGLDTRGLRSVAADGSVTQAFWDEWSAPPAELAEEALRRWLVTSGRYAAVTAAGSRLRANLVLEAELTKLEAWPAQGQARAAMAALLLTESEGGEPRVIGQFLPSGTAPIGGGERPGAAELAQAMQAALGACLAALDAELARHGSGRPAARPAGRATRRG